MFTNRITISSRAVVCVRVYLRSDTLPPPPLMGGLVWICGKSRFRFAKGTAPCSSLLAAVQSVRAEEEIEDPARDEEDAAASRRTPLARARHSRTKNRVN